MSMACDVPPADTVEDPPAVVVTVGADADEAEQGAATDEVVGAALDVDLDVL